MQLIELPVEMHLAILNNLSDKERARVRKTCTLFNELIVAIYIESAYGKLSKFCKFLDVQLAQLTNDINAYKKTQSFKYKSPQFCPSRQHGRSDIRDPRMETNVKSNLYLTLFTGSAAAYCYAQDNYMTLGFAFVAAWYGQKLVTDIAWSYGMAKYNAYLDRIFADDTIDYHALENITILMEKHGLFSKLNYLGNVNNNTYRQIEEALRTTQDNSKNAIAEFSKYRESLANLDPEELNLSKIHHKEILIYFIERWNKCFNKDYEIKYKAEIKEPVANLNMV